MSPKKILVYYTANKRTIAIETLCNVLHEAGHEVLVLTLEERGPFHEALEKNGIRTEVHVLPRKPGTKFFLGHARYLRRFCKKHQIDFVWSHLQAANIIAMIAQPFIKAKVFAFRHHAESAFYAEFGERFNMKRNKTEVLFDKIINRFAYRVVIPSSGVWYCMEKYEKANMKKVILLPYIYDFSAYAAPNEHKVKELRNQYSCKLLLIMVSRLIPTKQHMPVFETVRKLVAEGLSIKMIVMDNGPLQEELEKFIQDHQLQDHIFMIGFKEDFVNYMAVSDFLVHPSLTEASNNVVKEMGLLEKAVAVCEHIGDFSDYITDNGNGYFLDNKNLSYTIEKVIRDAYGNPEKLKDMGRALKQAVMVRFSDTPENKQHVLQLLN